MSILAAGVIALIGLALAVFFCVGARADSVAAGTGSAAISQAVTVGTLGLALGGILGAESLRLYRHAPAVPFRPRRLWLLGLALSILWVSGAVLASLENVSPWLKAPVHTLALLLLPALVLGIVGWTLQGRGGSWSDVRSGIVSGAILGTGVAVIAEILLLALLAGLLFATGALPQEWLREIPRTFPPREWSLPTDMEALLEFLTPAIALVGLVFVGGIVPLIEETAKTLGIGLAGLWLRPSPARAFLLGVASGAGFALAENLVNSIYPGPVWGIGVVARLVATMMHCAASGLMGWGWGEWWAGRRPWRLPLAFLGAVALHSVWNLTTIGAGLTGLLVLARANRPEWVALGGLLVLALGAFQILLTVGIAAALLWAGFRLGQREGYGPLSHRP